MKATAACVAILMAGCLAASAQYTNKNDVLDGAGVTSGGGGYANISAAGQPGGISIAMAGTLPVGSGTLVNQAGFLNTFLLKPGLDTNHNGVPDEIDPDNDGDALSDIAEIQGSSFNPVTPTDPNSASTAQDGISDGAKAMAGTNPNDTNAFLQITSITLAAGQCQVAWRARGNNERTYRVLSSSDLTQPFSTVIFSNTVAGGTYPWYVVTPVISTAVATNKLFYRVDVSP